MTHEELRELTADMRSVSERAGAQGIRGPCLDLLDVSEEVRSLIEVTNGLAYAVPQIDPPAALRARVLKAVEQSEPLRARRNPGSGGLALPVWLAIAASLAAVAFGLYRWTLRERIEGLEARLRDANAQVADAEQQIAVFRTRIDESSRWPPSWPPKTSAASTSPVRPPLEARPVERTGVRRADWCSPRPICQLLLQAASINSG